MKRVNIAEAKARLSELIDAALKGDDVVISRRNAPLVRLVRVEETTVRPRFGKLRGQIHLTADFDEPLPEFEDYI